MKVQKLVMWEVNWLQKTAHLTHRVLSQGARLQMASVYFDTGSKTLTEQAVYTRSGCLVLVVGGMYACTLIVGV